MINQLLPIIDPPADDESLQGYGIRVLTFVLNTGVTCTLSDRDLALADHVYPLAISGAEVSVLAVNRLSATRHLILGAIRVRKLIDAAVQAPVLKSVPPVAGSHPGKFATLTPSPKINPPAGVALRSVDVQF